VPEGKYNIRPNFGGKSSASFMLSFDRVRVSIMTSYGMYISCSMDLLS